MKTLRRSVKRRKTQKRHIGGREKNNIRRGKSGAIYIRPLSSFRRPSFLTQHGDVHIIIDGQFALVFVKLSNKWYALVSRQRLGISLITVVMNLLAETHWYLLPDFQVADGIIVNIGEGVSVDNTPVAERLMQIKKSDSV